MSERQAVTCQSLGCGKTLVGDQKTHCERHSTGEDTKGPWDDTGEVIRRAEEEGKVGTLEDLVKLCEETNSCLFYVVSEGGSVFAFSHEQMVRLSKGLPVEPEKCEECGGSGGGGPVEDPITGAPEQGPCGTCGGSGGPPYDAATATGMYDHD